MRENGWRCEHGTSGCATTAGAIVFEKGMRHAKSAVAATAPSNCATMKNGASIGRMPANVSLSDRAIVTAGFANEVDDVNQYAPTI